MVTMLSPSPGGTTRTTILKLCNPNNSKNSQLIKEESDFQKMVYEITNNKQGRFCEEDGIMSDGFHTPSPMSSNTSSTQETELLHLHHTNTKTLRMMNKVLQHIKTEHENCDSNSNHIMDLDESSNNNSIRSKIEFIDCCAPNPNDPPHHLYEPSGNGENTSVPLATFLPIRLHANVEDEDREDEESNRSQHHHEFSDSELDCDSCQSLHESIEHSKDPSTSSKKKTKGGKSSKKRNSREVRKCCIVKSTQYEPLIHFTLTSRGPSYYVRNIISHYTI